MPVALAMMEKVSEKNDPMLLPYLEARDEAEAKRHLGRLLEAVAFPVLDGVLRSKLGSAQMSGSAGSARAPREESEDLRGEMVARLIEKLARVREGDRDEAIGDFRAYAGTIAYSVVNQHWRRQYPRRFSLENQVRYLLEQTEGLALWQDDKRVWTCGFLAWRSRPALERGRLRVQEISQNPAAFEREALGQESAQRMSPVRLMAALFNHCGGPVPLDGVVSALAALWDIRDLPQQALPEQDEPPLERTQGLHEDEVGKEVVAKFNIKTYWMEMAQLPPRQVVSLVLDTQENMVRLLMDEGAVSPTALLRATELSAELLTSCLPNLPLKDAEIASLLGITSNYVAKMRVVSRQHLAARIGAAR